VHYGICSVVVKDYENTSVQQLLLRVISSSHAFILAFSKICTFVMHTLKMCMTICDFLELLEHFSKGKKVHFSWYLKAIDSRAYLHLDLKSGDIRYISELNFMVIFIYTQDFASRVPANNWQFAACIFTEFSYIINTWNNVMWVKIVY
jgi:hypothetical protein